MGGYHTTDRDQERIHQFLMGLDDDAYAPLRSTIVAQDPLPPLNKIYSLAIQEERMKTIAKDRDTKADALAFATQRPYSSRGPQGSVDKNTLSCSLASRLSSHLADILPKPLGQLQFQALFGKLGIRNVNAPT